MNLMLCLFIRELSFSKGDTIYLLRMIDSNWCEGEHHGRVGIFPMNYIEVRTKHVWISGEEKIGCVSFFFMKMQFG